ncbi:Vacuolar morphogenesis protein 6 [Vermiconidia calcicola]|uniref:Vacuolar morphogenesis protein 6 n=1 Tax=Vermiconidia calcicola TaxID=1690605 RepID=A0ACC3MJR1_9PEZI|nr:Vacuolar morphogenesis protein 6 [Vermiconidia calcicola]
MLSAFKAQPINELKLRDKSKIESLLAYGDRLLVGLNTGALRIYRVNETPQSEDAVGNGETEQATPSKAKPVDLLRDEEKFSKRPVQQLAIIKEANLLVSLSDGYISLHDLQSYQPVEKLERTKGATTFTVTSNVVRDPDTSVPSLVSRLAVAVKRKLLCWTWQDMEQLPEVIEISLEANIKSLTWATGTRLVAGMDPGFVVVDIEGQEATAVNKSTSRTGDAGTAELAGVRFGAVTSSGMGYMGMGSWVPKPMATALSENQIMLAKDVNTMFADIEGNPLEKRQIPWALAPEAIGYSYPYLLALQPPEKGTLQIRNPDSLSLLQTIPVPGAMILHVPQPNISLAHAGKGFLVASDRIIWRMNALPYDAQLQQLVEKQKFEEAISLLNLLEDTLIDDKAGRIREMMVLKGMLLFQERKYRQALDLFTDAEAPPERVIKLYPKSIAGDLSTVAEEPEPSDAEHGDDEPGTTNDVVKEPPSTPSKSLFGRVTGHARKDSDTASIKAFNRTETDTPSPRKAPSSGLSDSDKPLQGEDLKLAVRCLCSFLAQSRQLIQKYLNMNGTLKEDPPTRDSETGKSAFANLLPPTVFEAENENNIDWQGELVKVAQLVDTTLFRSYMLAQPSLAGPLFRLDNFCDPDVVQSSLYENHRYNDLIDFLHGKRLHQQALEMLTKFGKGEAESDVPERMRGPERTVSYLMQLPPSLIEIILEFAAWPVQEKPEVGMEVFVGDTAYADKLPRGRVLQFLADVDLKLEAQYLDHVINEFDDRTPEFHQQLVDLYLENVKSPTLSGEEKVDVQKKLENFLRRSKLYNKAKTFRQLPADDPRFFESRAVVLRAMGNHKQALAIYVFQVKDYDKAEQYCNEIYLTEAQHESGFVDNDNVQERPPFQRSKTEVSKNQPNIFATLLGLYLRPPSGEEKRWPQALELLGRHGARLPASSTLEFMPDDLAIAQLQDYFRGRMRHSTSLLRQEKVMRSLEDVRKANTERRLLLGKDEDAEKGKLLSVRARELKKARHIHDHANLCIASRSSEMGESGSFIVIRDSTY